MGDNALQCAGPSNPLYDRPIMVLLKSLIQNKQNTIMTNAQIIDILQKEFNIDVDSRHELEVDIFIKIIKKYLKDWPQWEDLERVSSRLVSLKDYDAIDKVLNHKYKNLKEYLGVRLDIAKESVQDLDEIKEDDNSKLESDVDSDVVMEIHCTRNQLNHLIIQRPFSTKQDSIFNTIAVDPSRIQYSTLTLEPILNLWCYKIVIFLPWLVYIRELHHNYEHILVNKVRKSIPEMYNFMPLLWQRKINVRGKTFERSVLIDKLNQLMVLLKLSSQWNELIEVVFKVIIETFNEGPEEIKVPGSCRRYCSNYKYVRYLCLANEMKEKNNKFDLQLEETVAPMIHYYVNKFSNENIVLPATLDWFKLECLQCKMHFVGVTNIAAIVNHYRDCHVNNEPEWQCFRCKRIFSMGYLAENMWHHDC